MGLFTTYSKANRVIRTETETTYSRNRIAGRWEYTVVNIGDADIVNVIDHAYEYRRFKSKVYAYVGMDYETAVDCAADATAYYTRATRVSEFSKTGATQGTFVNKSAGNIIMASVTINHVDGCMYSVEISVNEEDVLMSVSPASASTQFLVEDNLRGYDTGDQAFVEPN